MKQARAFNDDKSAIANWELVEDQDARFPTLAIPGILSLTSEVDTEECKKLLRAVVNSYINVKLHRQGIKLHWQRERKLLINYVKKENWEWQIELLDVARAYLHYPQRAQHRALLQISGNILRFDSEINSQYREL